MHWEFGVIHNEPLAGAKREVALRDTRPGARDACVLSRGLARGCALLACSVHPSPKHWRPRRIRSLLEVPLPPWDARLKLAGQIGPSTAHCAVKGCRSLVWFARPATSSYDLDLASDTLKDPDDVALSALVVARQKTEEHTTWVGHGSRIQSNPRAWISGPVLGLALDRPGLKTGHRKRTERITKQQL